MNQSTCPVRSSAEISLLCKKMNFIQGLRYFDPFLPFFVLIAIHYDINYFEIFLLQSVSSLSVVLFEMPAGFLSDFYGRKLSLTLSGALFILAYAIFFIKPSFETWIFGEIFAGIAFACFSGSDTSLLYEYSGSDCGTDYSKQETIMQSWARFAESISAFVGFFALTIHILMPIVISFFIKITMLISIIRLPKDPTHTKEYDYWRRIQITVRKIYSDKKANPLRYRMLMFLMIFSSAQSVLLLNVYWLLQVALNLAKIPTETIALVWLFYHFLSGMCARYSHNIFKVSVRSLLIFLPVFSICSLTVITYFPNFSTEISVLFLFSILWGLKIPLINFLINSNSLRDSRVTIHSLDSLITRISYIVLVPITGFLVQYSKSNLVYYWLICVIFPGLIASIKLKNFDQLKSA